MISAQSIISRADVLGRRIGAIEAKDRERWTLEECEAIKVALETLGAKASILYVACLTEEEMAELEREERDDG